MQFTFQKYLAQYEIPLLSLVDFLSPLVGFAESSFIVIQRQHKELRLKHKKQKLKIFYPKTEKSGKISIDN